MQLPEYQASEFGKVAVLMGGESAEREISLESGKAVHTALLNVGIDAYAIDYHENSFEKLSKNNFDRVFLALHGRGGEDGEIQRKLESIGLPYTGSDAKSSALAMDKIKTKSIWRDAGLPTPNAIEINENSDLDDLTDQVGLPVMIKPVREGSSFGATKVDREESLFSAWTNASKFDDRVMAESWIEGAEYTVPILGDTVLPVIKLETKRKFYDYEAKYNSKAKTKHVIPVNIANRDLKKVLNIAYKAHKLIGCRGVTRSDFKFYNGKFYLLEINTQPGMTKLSLVPEIAAYRGMSFINLIEWIINDASINR